MYLIGLSGPPRSGKDTLGLMLRKEFQRNGILASTCALSFRMRQAVYGLLGIEYTLEHYETYKDQPQELFHGRTIRQEMIELSERHMKPRLGQDFWAHAWLIHIRRHPETQVAIITDMGFQSEIEKFEDELGAENCAWVQIQRDGYDFSKDSRSYVGGNVNNSHISNNGTVGDLLTEAIRIYGRCRNNYGWQF